MMALRLLVASEETVALAESVVSVDIGTSRLSVD